MAAPPPPRPPTVPVVSISRQARLAQKMTEVQRVYATLRPQIQWIQNQVEATADQVRIYPSRIAEAAEYIQQKIDYMNDQITVKKNGVAHLDHTQELYNHALEMFREEIEEAAQHLDEDLPLDETKTDELVNKIIQFARPLNILPQLKLQLDDDGTDTLLENHKKAIENIRQRYYRLRENVSIAMAQSRVEALDRFATDTEAYNNKGMKEICTHVEKRVHTGLWSPSRETEQVFRCRWHFFWCIEGRLAALHDVEADSATKLREYNTERGKWLEVKQKLDANVCELETAKAQKIDDLEEQRRKFEVELQAANNKEKKLTDELKTTKADLKTSNGIVLR